jgi:cellulose synthase/poly-beta-1,6-N-acetylglucosamine synthase-like glycosyltransferase
MLWLPVILALLLAVASLKGERARAAYYRARLTRDTPTATPPATVIVPVKGVDEGLSENLTALAELDYPDFELIVVARSEQDVPPGVTPPGARLVLAGKPQGQESEKIHNLLEAVGQARPASGIFVFADSDGRVPRGWLRALAAALEEPGAGAATGYRWHLPAGGGFWSLLRSAWNAAIAGGMGPGENRFAWGGATAIRRETFARARVADYWKDAVSDDYRLSEAVHDLGFRVVFAPGALVASTGRTGVGELLEWVRRQLMITRFYAVKLWILALVAHAIYCSAMIAAVLLMAQGSRLAGAALVVPIGIGMWKAARRLRLARLALPEHEPWFRRWGWAHVLLTPLATWLWLYAAAAAGVSNRIRWRGCSYRLRFLAKPEL